jgi:hypothetical protein
VFDPMAVTLLIAFNTALEQDTKKKPKKSEDVINSLENYLNNTPKEQLDIDFKEIDDLVEKNYEIYGDSEKIEENLEENINIFSDTEESVSITSKAPYYTLSDFDWDNKSLWINDRHAIKYWMRTQRGNQRDLDKLKDGEDFTQKSY